MKFLRYKSWIEYRSNIAVSTAIGIMIGGVGALLATELTPVMRSAIASASPLKGMDQIVNPCENCQHMDSRGPQFCRCRMNPQDEVMFQAWVSMPLDVKLTKLKAWGRTPEEAFRACDVYRIWNTNGREYFPTAPLDELTKSYATVRLALEHMGY